MYICFEWTVGTGKTTQSKILHDYLQKKYPDREVIRVREPGKTPIAEAIRTLVQWTPFDEAKHISTPLPEHNSSIRSSNQSSQNDESSSVIDVSGHRSPISDMRSD